MKWCLQSFIREPRSVMGSEGWMKKVTTLEWHVYRILWRFVLLAMLYRSLKWRYTSLKRVVNITVVAIEDYSRGLTAIASFHHLTNINYDSFQFLHRNTLKWYFVELYSHFYRLLLYLFCFFLLSLLNEFS